MIDRLANIQLALAEFPARLFATNSSQGFCVFRFPAILAYLLRGKTKSLHEQALPPIVSMGVTNVFDEL